MIKDARNEAEKEQLINATRSWEDFIGQASEGDKRQMNKLKLVYKLRTQTKEYGSYTLKSHCSFFEY